MLKEITESLNLMWILGVAVLQGYVKVEIVYKISKRAKSGYFVQLTGALGIIPSFISR